MEADAPFHNQKAGSDHTPVRGEGCPPLIASRQYSCKSLLTLLGSPTLISMPLFCLKASGPVKSGTCDVYSHCVPGAAQHTQLLMLHCLQACNECFRRLTDRAFLTCKFIWLTTFGLYFNHFLKSKQPTCKQPTCRIVGDKSGKLAHDVVHCRVGLSCDQNRPS